MGMGFFTVGNLITLAIVGLMLFLYRQLDRKNRSLERMRKFADKVKGELDAYAEKKAEEVKNYGINLKVEQQAAAELMKRVQSLTEKDLADKVAAVARIDERINAYDLSLDELVKMTGRVQENLNRIRDESAFVENTNRQVGEAKEKLNEMEKELGGLLVRFERENTDALDRAAETALSTVKSTVANLETQAKAIAKQVEEHREAVDKIEHDRAASLARDMNIVNKTLKEAVEKAGSRADKMEEAALVKLRDQAQDRVSRLQAAWEEKLKTAQETVKTRLAEIQEQFRAVREEWKTGQGEIEALQKQYRETWTGEVRELDTLVRHQREDWDGAVKRQREEIDALIAGQEETWGAVIRDTEQRLLEETGARLEEYRRAQAEEIRQLAALADDAARLEGELRLSMQETVNRVNADFIRFEDEAARSRESTAVEFSAQVLALKTEMDGLERNLDSLKDKAYDNVSEKLKVFEDDFFADLNKRSAEIETRLLDWQSGLDARLAEIAEDEAGERRQAELRIHEELQKNLAGQGERMTAELERLKAETAAFEEGIREEMLAADETRRSFQEQLGQDLEEARRLAEDSAKNEISRYSLSMAETLKQNQRELEERLREIQGQVEEKNGEIAGFLDDSRRSMEEWQNGYSARIRELDASMDEARRRIRDMVDESDERLASMRSSIDDMKKEFTSQTRLFDRAGELKLELERHIEDLKGELDRLDQRKNEIAQMENQFVRIKRLEDDVNAKMTRFLSEKHRIETMETGFNRLLQTSQAVEEKLVQVSSSDDTLQTLQVQIRRLDDAIRETDEKYQRIERKGQILEETNEGIDRNFKALQESEEAVRRTGEELGRISRTLDSLSVSIETLAADNEKARETMDKLAILDDSLTHIEKRIGEMQVAREWIARSETRMEELDKQAQTKLRLVDSLLNQSGKPPSAGKGAPPPRDRDNIIKLHRQGWTLDQLSRTLNISKGEVELILEIGLKEEER
jgi:chromosome segregation ATPase